MQKKLTVLFAFAIFVLVLGLQTDSYADHKPKHNPGGGGGGDKVVAEYSVEITGAVSGHSLNDWPEQGGNGIGWGDPNDLAGQFTEWSYFETAIEFNGFGINCFGESPISPLEIQFAGLRQRKGSAEGSFWINGWTADGKIPVVYLLDVLGTPIDTDWPRPSEKGDTTSSDMTKWEMGLKNGQPDLKDISCIGEGTFDVLNSMTIKVTRGN